MPPPRWGAEVHRRAGYNGELNRPPCENSAISCSERCRNDLRSVVRVAAGQEQGAAATRDVGAAGVGRVGLNERQRAHRLLSMALKRACRLSSEPVNMVGGSQRNFRISSAAE